MANVQTSTTDRADDRAVSFGWSYSIAVLTVAVVNALEGLSPDFEEWGEATFSQTWLHIGVLGILIFLVLGLLGLGRGQDPRPTAFVIVASTLIAGLITIGAGALAGTRGSM